MKNPISVSALGVLSMALTCGLSIAQVPPAKSSVLTKPSVGRAMHADLSLPLKVMALAQSGIPADEEIDHPVLLPKAALQEGFTAAGRPPVNGAAAASLPLGPTAASVGVNYLGVGVGFNGYSVPDAPTDVNLAVGDTQVVQWVNVSYAVFDKAGGGVFKIQTLGNALWSGFGAPCETHNSGDIIAQWDKVAHRWVVVPTSIYSAVRGLFCDLPDAGRIRPVLPLRLQHE